MKVGGQLSEDVFIRVVYFHLCFLISTVGNEIIVNALSNCDEEE